MNEPTIRRPSIRTISWRSRARSRASTGSIRTCASSSRPPANSSYTRPYVSGEHRRGELKAKTGPSRQLFIEVFDEEAARIEGVKWLAQGTIYPDVIESAGAATGKAHLIKSHHNVGGLPEQMKLKLIEPLRDLFKDEVRRIGIELGLCQGNAGNPQDAWSSRVDAEMMAADAHDENRVELDLLLGEIYQRYHYHFRSYARSSLRRRIDQAQFSRDGHRC